ncbi:MAG: SDR family NAD(P)-dependent oxidoreductase [Gammaproteobacteria bacterium]|nr:SDR family NAD(P)-dependent oxidoreductase [Gammaproteobacteria bacterium]
MDTLVVTGAASGIGRACVLQAGQYFEHVTLVDRDREGLQRTRECMSTEKAVKVVAADVTDESNVSLLFTDLQSEGLSVRGLINSAGVEMMAGIEVMSLQQWRRQWDINVTSMFLTCKYAVPSLKSSRGSIVNVASVLGLIVAPDHIAYCASKGGVRQFTKALGFDLAPFGVRVNCVLPGPIDTPMYRKTMGAYPDPEAAHVEHTRKIPLARLGTPEDVANVIHFLLGPAAAFVTCAEIVVDGGFTASRVDL